MEQVEFRVAVPDDAAAVARYHERCVAKTFAPLLLTGQFEAPDSESTRQQLHDWFKPATGFETLVAVIGDGPIGHVTVCRHQLVHLFVEPAHQAAGLGRRLLGKGEAMIIAAGYAEFELHARVENLAAIGFYEAAGWTMTEQLVRTVEHGISYDEHVLVKSRPS